MCFVCRVLCDVVWSVFCVCCECLRAGICECVCFVCDLLCDVVWCVFGVAACAYVSVCENVCFNVFVNVVCEILCDHIRFVLRFCANVL